MLNFLRRIRQLRLRNLLLVFLMTYGCLSLVISALTNVRQNGQLVETLEQISLTHRVEALSRQLGGEVSSGQQLLQQLADTLLSIPSSGVSSGVRDRWVDEYLRTFAEKNQLLRYVRVALVEQGREFGPSALPAEVEEVMSEAISDAVLQGSGGTRFVLLAETKQPAVVITEVGSLRGAQQAGVVLTALVPLDFPPEGQTMTFLVDSEGAVLWAEDPDPAYLEALGESTLIADFVNHPSVFVSEYWQEIGDLRQRVIAQVSPIARLGWGVVVQQPKSTAFGVARQVVNSTLVSALLMLVLALVFAVGASQVVSSPIQRLAERSSEIAAGNFGGRVPPGGLSRELVNLADSFNVMSGHVEKSVERLRRAAEENHELFLGSIRAILAAVEAKEPYTRGHSERVAAFSQAIARHLESDAEFQEQVWVAGLLHDVGKIGIDDRILKKGNALTEEEFEEIKRHPIIGEEIMASIDRLSYSLPAIRWHHEKWNGRGYPDGLRREAIPLMARIVSVADSFDAMTTQRVYQEAMSPQEAVSWIRKQNGIAFDARVVEAFLKAYLKEEVKAVDSSPIVAAPEEPIALAVGDSVYT